MWVCFCRYGRLDHTRQSERTERPSQQQCHGYHVLQQPSLPGWSKSHTDSVIGVPGALSSSLLIISHSLPLQITKGLTEELNKLYSLFCSRNPDFEKKGGKVSIVSHSLGCVIAYDIITGWDPVRFCLQEHRVVEEDLDLRWMSYEERHLLEQQRQTRNR